MSFKQQKQPVLSNPSCTSNPSTTSMSEGKYESFSNVAYRRKQRAVSTDDTGKASSASSGFGKPKNRFYVNHTYRDHAHDSDDEILEVNTQMNEPMQLKMANARGGVTDNFPKKLYEMLSKAKFENFEHIVSWHPHGRSFSVHQRKQFVNEIMPRFFHQTMITSFQRQLNLYGFCRQTTGPDRGGYYHELFLRGHPHLCERMVRTRVKGTGVKALTSPSTEPNFYNMEPCPELSCIEQQETDGSKMELPWSDVPASIRVVPTVVTGYRCSRLSNNHPFEGVLAPYLTDHFPCELSTPSSSQAAAAAMGAHELRLPFHAAGSYDTSSRCPSSLSQIFESGCDDVSADVWFCQPVVETPMEPQMVYRPKAKLVWRGVSPPRRARNVPDFPYVDRFGTSLEGWQENNAFDEPFASV